MMALVTIIVSPMTLSTRVRVVLVSTESLASEMENHTWDTLRTIPFPTSQIIRSKYAGGMLRTQRLFYSLFMLRFGLGGVFIGVVSFAFIASMIGSQVDAPAALEAPLTARQMLLAPAAIAMLIYSITEPLLDYAVDSALGLTIGAFNKTRGQALTYGIGWGIGTVVVQMLINVGLMLGLLRQPALLVAVPLIMLVRYAAIEGLLALTQWRSEAMLE
jgi:hypothetical protein